MKIASLLMKLCRKFVVRSLSSVRDTLVKVRGSSKTNGSTVVTLERGKPLTWYACGPTVYDVAHIGHARNYVATDILRRILTAHFQYEVNFALGMTDVDDKIIEKGKERHCKTLEEFIFLAYKYELAYTKDMDSLLVMRPNATLRVTEHIPEIVSFIQSLIERKHAYIARNGVYFSIKSLTSWYNYDKFGCAPGVNRLLDDAARALVDIDYEATSPHKQDPRDFALWKVVPDNEPVGWPSPYGYGRPGWHIECSAMTYQYFGRLLDIHSGGIDLKFPHHNNEIVQSECHHCAEGEDWVRLWIHTGHLHIQGRKMSKSLKNFISIQDYLQSRITSNPAIDFRIFCLHHKYSAFLTYTDKHIEIAEQYRMKLQGFISMVDLLQSAIEVTSQGRLRYSAKSCETSRQLHTLLLTTKQHITEALADNFDTPLALNHINNLLSESQKYITSLKSQIISELKSNLRNDNLPLEPLLAVRHYIIGIFSHSFGLPLGTTAKSDAIKEDHKDANRVIAAAVDFRAKIRAFAINHLKKIKTTSGDPAGHDQLEFLKQLLTECDVFRDNMLQEHKVKVEDIGAGFAKWTKQS